MNKYVVLMVGLDLFLVLILALIFVKGMNIAPASIEALAEQNLPGLGVSAPQPGPATPVPSSAAGLTPSKPDAPNSPSATVKPPINPFDVDTDHDGLTDGQEKLYGTNPNDPYDPGIYVEYSSDLKTSKYFSWEQHGTNFIARSSVVIRRGSAFWVGGPQDAAIQIQKSASGLTTLGVQRDNGRWKVTVPADGTVGKYIITLTKGSWSKSLSLYVIFELPTNMSDADLAAFDYSNDPNNFRDEYAIWFLTSDDTDPSNRCPGGSRIPNCHITGGRAFAFRLDQYDAYVFEDHVINVINGYTDPYSAAVALGHHVDSILKMQVNSLQLNMWDALHAPDQQAQCSTQAAVLTSLLRGAGIPARPVVTDWNMLVVGNVLFDHATEVWLSGNWQVMRAYRDSPPVPTANTGIFPPVSRDHWIYRPPQSDLILVAGNNWDINQVETDFNHTQNQFDYFMGSWDYTKIVKWDWVQTELGPYWGQPEPAKIGDPYQTWLAWPSGGRAPAPMPNGPSTGN